MKKIGYFFSSLFLATFFLAFNINVFSQSITVTAPVGTDVWGVGTSHDITWTPAGTTGDFDITLCTDAGVLVQPIITDDVSPYTWAIPVDLDPGSYKIKIVDHSGTPVEGLSATFSVAKITVTAPVTGNTWQTGTAHDITWTSAGTTGDFDITLCTDAGVHVQNIIVTGTVSPYSWSIPGGLASGSYKIKIVDHTLVAPIGGLSGAFNIITPAVTVVTPSGSASWRAGTSQTISWVKTDFADNVDIELWNAAGTAKVSDIVTNVAGLSYVWPIPNGTAPDSYRIQVRKTGGATFGNSAVFGIVAPYIKLTSPNGGEDWQRGTLKLITWTKLFGEKVKVELCNDAGAVLSILKPSTYGQAVNWFIPAGTAAGDYKIKVSSVTDALRTDISDAHFHITAVGGGGGGGAGTITLESPNGGEDWQRGTLKLIEWNKTFTENVKVELCDNAGAVVTILKASTYGQAVNWFIPAGTPAGDYNIKVTSVTDPLKTDYSDAHFHITAVGGGGGGAGTIILESPNGGEDWQRGTLKLIEWDKTFPENVKVELCNDAGAVLSILKASTYGQAVNWFIPAGTAAGDYKIKVSSITDPAKTDISAAHFHITAVGGGGGGGAGTILLESPNGGENWQRGTLKLIEWDKTFPENVKVELCNDAGAVLSILKASTYGQAVNWFIPGNTVAGDYKIKVSSITDPAKTDISAAHFHITDMDFIVFPNPANNNLSMAFDNSSTGTYDLCMYDRFGGQVITKSVNTDTGKEHSISTSDLPSGIYYLVLTQGETRITKTIVVQH